MTLPGHCQGTPGGWVTSQWSQGPCSGGLGGGEEGQGGSQHGSAFQGCGIHGEIGVQAGNILLVGARVSGVPRALWRVWH